MHMFAFSGYSSRQDYAGCLMAVGFAGGYIGFLLVGNWARLPTDWAEFLSGEYLSFTLSLAIVGLAILWAFTASTIRRARDADLLLVFPITVIAGLLPLAAVLVLPVFASPRLFNLAHAFVVVEVSSLFLVTALLVSLDDCKVSGFSRPLRVFQDPVVSKAMELLHLQHPPTGRLFQWKMRQRTALPAVHRSSSTSY